MKHLAKIQSEFLKEAAVPEWWRKLTPKEQQEYIKTHPGTRLRIIYPSKEIAGMKIRKIDPRNRAETSQISDITAKKMDLIKVLGKPNYYTKEDGEGWVIDIQGTIVNIWGQDKNNNWRVSGVANTPVMDKLNKILAR